MTISLCILMFLWLIDFLILFYVLKSYKNNKFIKSVLLNLESSKLNNTLDDEIYIESKTDLLSELESNKLLLFGVFIFIIYFFSLLFLSYVFYTSFKL